MNIALILQMAADAAPDRTAIVSGETRLTFADLASMAVAAADAQSRNGRLVFADENHPAAPAALFGAAIAGVPFAPVNYRLAAEQIGALLRRLTPARLVTDQAIGAEIEGIVPVSRGAFTAARSQSPDIDAPEDAEIAIELFTSGTTGEPKSAVLRHDNLMAYILGTVEFLSAGEEEATLISVPPYHIAGVSAVLSSTYACRRMVQLPSFSAQAWLSLAAAENVTNAFVVPTMLQRIIAHVADNPGAADLPALRAIAYGGGKMPRSVIETAMDIFPHVDFTNAYGLTETSSTICLLGPEAHRAAHQADDPVIRRRLSSVGQPLPTVELEVRRENGDPCAAEEPGLVFVRGDQVSGEYRGAGSQLDADGWFPTKDRGFLDAEGFLFLDGRSDDVIVRGGENISPGEIEDVLMMHESVLEAAVVAAPDAEWGEAVAAVIVAKSPHPDAEDLRAFVREKLRSSKTPSVIRFVDELPYNETGKLLRRVIRDGFANA